MWKLSIEHINLASLKPQYTQDGTTSVKFYKFFGYLLLKGVVITALAPYSKSFKDSPSLILDDQSLSPKVTRMLASLHKFDIDSLEKLRQIWSQNSLFLQDCLILWIDTRHKDQIKNLKKEWDSLINV